MTFEEYKYIHTQLTTMEHLLDTYNTNNTNMEYLLNTYNNSDNAYEQYKSLVKTLYYDIRPRIKSNENATSSAEDLEYKMKIESSYNTIYYGIITLFENNIISKLDVMDILEKLNFKWRKRNHEQNNK